MPEAPGRRQRLPEALADRLQQEILGVGLSPCDRLFTRLLCRIDVSRTVVPTPARPSRSLPVRVNAPTPRSVRTAILPPLRLDDRGYRPYVMENTAQHCAAKPSGSEPMAVSPASGRSSFISRSVVVLDGGYKLW